MASTNNFYYDDNELLKLVQYQLQHKWMLHYFRKVREMISFSLRLISDNQSELASFSEIIEFNPKALLSTHNVMAAVFRREEYNINQGDLFTKNSMIDQYSQKWINWFSREADTLKMSPAFVERFAQAILLDNSEDWNHAESKLNNYVLANYNCEEWLDTKNIRAPLL